MYDNIDQLLFHLINGSAVGGLRLYAAIVAAKWLILLVPFGLTLMWLRGDAGMRSVALRAVLATAAGLLTNWLIALVWFHPRPFMVGLAENLLQHAPDSSFPSDHATVMFTVAFVLLGAQLTRAWGAVLCGAALATAWARVYLGVHYPLDMAGAAAMALCMARLFGAPPMLRASETALALVEPAYRRALAAPIRRGWIRP